jgi:nucleotide-binding universal stress UspA family protein
MKTSSISRARARQRLIRNIMVPVDFSDCSLTGLRYALKFAKEVGARLIVLHVADLGPVLIGSVAEGTLRNAACPVFVVPSFSRVRKGPVTRPVRPRRKQSLES